MLPNIGSMSYIRDKKKTLASGEVARYYEEVESYWEDSKVKQRVIKYLGKYPYQTQVELDPELASQVARILADTNISPKIQKEKLKDLGIPVPQGKLKEAKIIFNPPPKKPTLFLYCK